MFVGELSVAGNQRTTVVVARNHWATEAVERLVETGVGQVRQIENHANPLELLEQFDSPGRQRPAHAGAKGIMTFAEVRQHHAAQAVFLRLLGLRWFDNRVGAFHAENNADGQFVATALAPNLLVCIQLAGCADELYLTLFLKNSVISQLPLGPGVSHALCAIIEIQPTVA